MTDALVRETGASLVVRYNGGPQAAHHVTTDDGRVHCFSQFGSGTLAGAATYLSEYVTLDLPALEREAQHLRELGVSNPYASLTVHPKCPVVTPYHRAMNHLRELARGTANHGSCGRGVGEVARELAQGLPVVRVADFADPARVRALRQDIQFRLVCEARELGLHRTLEEANRAWEVLSGPIQHWEDVSWGVSRKISQWDTHPTLPDVTIFEGAQGVLLDEWYGFHPHTTWSTCTFEQARTLCARWGITEVQAIGVTRSYHTRHGAGPFPSEIADGSVRAQWTPHERNSHGTWQGGFRVGFLDLPLLQYACTLAQPDVLAVTHMDVVTPDWRVLAFYRDNPLIALTGSPNTRDAVQLYWQEEAGRRLLHTNPVYARMKQPDELPAVLQEATGVPVGYLAYGPSAASTETRQAVAA
jgi:adenylosuccinate synthase